MRIFHVADLCASGELHASCEYDYAALEQIPGASDLIGAFSGGLYSSPEEFERPISGNQTMVYRWHSTAKTSGTATLRNRGALVSFALLASGLNSDADRITLAAFQTHLLRELHDTSYEPAFDLLTLPQRPLLVTVGFHEPADRSDQLLAALADRCFAAAYFRYLGLV